jgi:subtilisin family serine protease
MKKMRIERFGKGTAAAVFIVLLTCGSSPLQPVKGTAGETGYYPGLDSQLGQLIDTYVQRGTRAARRFANRHGIVMLGDRVQVVAEAEGWGTDLQVQAAASAAALAVEDLGGQVETGFRHMIQSLIPVGSLQALSVNGAVKHVRLPLRPVPLETSEGVGSTGADQWHAAYAYRSEGTPARVCVLDLGFRGYEDLLGTELPAGTQTVSFRADGDISAGTSHGTASAEVIHDMAPAAGLVLVNYATDVEHHQAVEWIIANDIDIVSYSMGWLSAGAGDGTGPICEDVKKAYEAGIVWISAAGNSASHHWHGKFTDRSGDSWHEFDKKNIDKTDYFSFSADKGDRFSIWLNWDDWGTWTGTVYAGSEGNDYDLYLYDRGLNLLEKSNSKQTQGAAPLEGISFKARYQGKHYIRIKKRKAPRDCILELFFTNVSQLEHVEPYSSINVPADSPHAVAVGAVGFGDDAAHAYSSRGPTNDKRIKPDVCAPAGVSTVTYGKYGFYGTSAAAAHVAGAVALLKEKTPYTTDQILAIIKARLTDLGPAGKDNLYGDGRLNLTK